MSDTQENQIFSLTPEMQPSVAPLSEKLILCIGNTRLHWGYFINNSLQATWDTSMVDRSQLATLLDECGQNHNQHDNILSTQPDFITPRSCDLGGSVQAQLYDNDLDHTLNKTGTTFEQTCMMLPDLETIDPLVTINRTVPKSTITASDLVQFPITLPNPVVNSTCKPSPVNPSFSPDFPTNLSQPSSQTSPPSDPSDSTQDGDFPSALKQHLQAVRSLWLVSVVPQQTHIWHTELQQRGYQVRQLTLTDLPLQATYPTLGIDRALNCVGALWRYRTPCLVIDGGTALTYSAVIQTTGHDGQFLGGAILPGLRLQYQALGQQTAQLPWLNTLQLLQSFNSTEKSGDRRLPRWAKETNVAIQSGILYTIGAGLAATIADWLCQYPAGQILLTGGDALLLKIALLLHLKTQPSPGLELTEDLAKALEEMNDETKKLHEKALEIPLETETIAQANPVIADKLEATFKTELKKNSIPILGRENLHIEPQLMFSGIQALLT